MSDRDAAWHALQAHLDTPPYPNPGWRGHLLNVSEQLDYLMGVDAEIHRFEEYYAGQVSWAIIDIRQALNGLWTNAARGYVLTVEEAASWVDSPGGEPPWEKLPLSPGVDPFPDRRTTGEWLERFADRHPEVHEPVRELVGLVRGAFRPDSGHVDLVAMRAADAVLSELVRLLRNDLPE